MIWKDPGPLSPEQIRVGPPAALPAAIANAAGRPIECRFEHRGLELGGKTPKFSCRTPEGESLRLKYYDGAGHGNREVFAEVAATRLMWALGFDTDPVFPVIVDCQDCPADPWTGEGPRQTRRFDAEYEPHYVGTLITSTKDPDQGWAFGELEKAIDSLPPGPLRMPSADPLRRTHVACRVHPAWRPEALATASGVSWRSGLSVRRLPGAARRGA